MVHRRSVPSFTHAMKLRSLPSCACEHGGPKARAGWDYGAALGGASQRSQMAELLIRAGAGAAVANDYGVTAVSEAAGEGNAAMVGMLLKAGAAANTASPEGETVLMTAARAGDADTVRVLIEHGAVVDAHESWKGQTALIWAAAGDHAEAAKILIEHGADVNARSTVWPEEVKRPSNGNLVSKRPKGGLTPLLYAAREGALDSARVLAAAGADLNITEPDGISPVIMALINGHYDVAALLLEAGADRTSPTNGVVRRCMPLWTCTRSSRRQPGPLREASIS